MKKINSLKRNEDFNRIIQAGKAYKYKDYIIYKEKNEVGKYRIGISVGKKVGNAVTRNKIKRQIKSILDRCSLKKDYDCIIIIRKSILEKKYKQMEEDLKKALENVKIVEE